LILPEGVDVQSIIDNYLEGIGGKDQVMAIKSLKLVYEGTALGTTVKREEKTTSDKYAQTTYMNNTAMTGVVGKEGEIYMKQGTNKVPLPPEMQKELAYAIGVLPEIGIAAHQNAKFMGVEKVDGKDAYKIEIPGEVVRVSFFYDVETGLKVQETTVITMNGQTQNRSIIFKDYQEFQGIKFPTLRIGNLGTEVLESRLLEATVNGAMEDSDFE
ncbi:MAG: insulinase family protein, partial [Flavobacteriaceae bacterium]